MTVSANRKHPKVLVVEDDDAIRGLLVSALRREPLVVHAAADGIQAANLIAGNEYALMLVDFMLPCMSGVDFLRHFRETRPSCASVVLVMTASDDQVVATLTSDLVHGIIRKPFDLLGLVSTISEISATWEALGRPEIASSDEPWLVC